MKISTKNKFHTCISGFKELLVSLLEIHYLCACPVSWIPRSICSLEINAQAVDTLLKVSSLGSQESSIASLSQKCTMPGDFLLLRNFCFSKIKCLSVILVIYSYLLAIVRKANKVLKENQEDITVRNKYYSTILQIIEWHALNLAWWLSRQTEFDRS